MHLLNWLIDNVLSNAIADIVCGIPAFMLAMWRFERRHKRHMQQIHNQISQSLSENR